jgi:hypothetical protein
LPPPWKKESGQWRKEQPPCFLVEIAMPDSRSFDAISSSDPSRSVPEPRGPAATQLAMNFIQIGLGEINQISWRSLEMGDRR